MLRPQPPGRTGREWSVTKRVLDQNWKRGAVSLGMHSLERQVENGRIRWVFRCGAVAVPAAAKTIGRWARDYGSTRISTVICTAITVACVRRPLRREENSDSRGYSGSLVKRRSLASRKSSSPEASRFCWKISATILHFLRRGRSDHSADQRNVVYRTARKEFASVAAGSNSPANQSGQRNARASRPPSRARNMGANTRRHPARSCAWLSSATGGHCFDRCRGGGVSSVSR